MELNNELLYRSPLLQELLRFTNPEYIQNEVKLKFNDKYYQFYGGLDFKTPQGAILLDKYKLTQNNPNPNTGITTKHFFYHEFNDFIIEFLKDCFVDFYDNFLNYLMTHDNEKENKVYYSNHLNLLKIIIEDLKSSKGFNKEILGILLKGFRKGLKIFKDKFGEKKINIVKKRKNVPHSFKFKHYTTRPFELNIFREKLINSGLIESTTGSLQFSKLFSGDKVCYKVNWRGKKNQLYYFIKYMDAHSEFISTGDYKWEIAMKCFDFTDKKTGKQFSWKKLKGTHDPIPKYKSLIENCFNIF